MKIKFEEPGPWGIHGAFSYVPACACKYQRKIQLAAKGPANFYPSHDIIGFGILAQVCIADYSCYGKLRCCLNRFKHRQSAGYILSKGAIRVYNEIHVVTYRLELPSEP